MDRLKLPPSVFETLLDEARRSLPNECCGLLAGHGTEATRVLPATNALASPVAYEIRPRELFALFRHLREEKLDLVGIYHSHPTGDNAPSGRDLERAFYPEAAYVILSALEGVRQPVRAFRLAEGTMRELLVELGD